MSSIKTQKLFSIRDITFIAMFTAIITICAWISVPLPPPFVPFTMQTFAVFLTIGVLGVKNGTMSVILYILLGALGVPVFAGFRGGIAVLMDTTGGYIMGFVLTAIVTGFIIKHFGNKVPVMFTAMVLGMITYFVFGTVWFMVVYTNGNGPIGLMTALSMCVLPYIVPDIIKISLAILLAKRVGKFAKLR